MKPDLPSELRHRTPTPEEIRNRLEQTAKKKRIEAMQTEVFALMCASIASGIEANPSYPNPAQPPSLASRSIDVAEAILDEILRRTS